MKNGAPGAIRTPDPLIRSQVLYPAELRVLKDIAAHKPAVRFVQWAFFTWATKYLPLRTLKLFINSSLMQACAPQISL